MDSNRPRRVVKTTQKENYVYYMAKRETSVLTDPCSSRSSCLNRNIEVKEKKKLKHRMQSTTKRGKKGKKRSKTIKGKVRSKKNKDKSRQRKTKHSCVKTRTIGIQCDEAPPQESKWDYYLKSKKWQPVVVLERLKFDEHNRPIIPRSNNLEVHNAREKSTLQNGDDVQSRGEVPHSITSQDEDLGDSCNIQVRRDSNVCQMHPQRQVKKRSSKKSNKLRSVRGNKGVSFRRNKLKTVVQMRKRYRKQFTKKEDAKPTSQDFIPSSSSYKDKSTCNSPCHKNVELDHSEVTNYSQDSECEYVNHDIQQESNITQEVTNYSQNFECEYADQNIQQEFNITEEVTNYSQNFECEYSNHDFHQESNITGEVTNYSPNFECEYDNHDIQQESNITESGCCPNFNGNCDHICTEVKTEKEEAEEFYNQQYAHNSENYYANNEATNQDWYQLEGQIKQEPESDPDEFQENYNGGEEVPWNYHNGGGVPWNFNNGGEVPGNYNDAGEVPRNSNDGGEWPRNYNEGGEVPWNNNDEREEHWNDNFGREVPRNYNDGGEMPWSYNDREEEHWNYNDGEEVPWNNNYNGFNEFADSFHPFTNPPDGFAENLWRLMNDENYVTCVYTKTNQYTIGNSVHHCVAHLIQIFHMHDQSRPVMEMIKGYKWVTNIQNEL